MAILIALIIVLKTADINIYTDSQCAIEILKFQKSKNKRWNISANPIITQLIHETIKSHTGQINTFKVAAYTEDKYNELADKLAKISEPHNPPGNKIVLPNPTQLQEQYAFLQYQNTTLDISTKTFLKSLHNTKWIARWKTQNRHQAWLDNLTETQIDWKTTWNLQYPSKITNFLTSPEDHNSRIFKFKLLNNELPTKSNLHQRKPDLYKNSTCFKYQQNENTDHILTQHNQATLTYNKFIETAKHQISSRAQNKQNRELNNMLSETIPLSNRNVILISKSITTKELFKNIQKIVGTKEKTRETLNSIYENINIYIKQI